MDSIGQGLGALAFWGFIAAVAVAGHWDNAKKRQAQHETLRRMLESGKPVDEELMARLMGGGKSKRPDRDLAIGAIIVFSIAVGLAVLAVVLSGVATKAFMPLLGAGSLCACLAGGLKVASIYVRRSQLEDENPTRYGSNAA